MYLVVCIGDKLCLPLLICLASGFTNYFGYSCFIVVLLFVFAFQNYEDDVEQLAV